MRTGDFNVAKPTQSGLAELLPTNASGEPDASALPFSDAWTQWRAYRISSSRPIARSTLADYDSMYRCYLGPFFGELPLPAFSAQAIDAFQVEMHRQGVSAVRYGKIVVPLRACLRWHRGTGAFTQDTTFWFSSPAPTADERKVLTFEQAERLIAEVPAFYRPLVSCALYTGMRFGEIRALGWHDVDLDSGVVHIRRAMDLGVVRSYTKTMGSRSVGLPEHVADTLRDWQQRCPQSELSLVFPDEAGRPLDPDSFRARVFKPAVLRAGINPSFRIHDMRHTAASWYVRAGASVIDLMNVFGWSQLQTALRYIHRYETPITLASKLSRARGEQVGTR